MENQLPTTPITPNQPSEAVVSKPNNFLIWLLAVLLILSVIIAGFFAYQTQKLAKELTLLRAEPSPISTLESIDEPVATSSSEIDPTADWKTHTDQKNKIIFKYPNSWNLITADESQYKSTFNPGYFLYKVDPKVPCGGAIGNGGGGPCMNSASIQFSFGNTKPDTQDFDQDFWGVGFIITKKANVKVGGIEVVQAYTGETRYPYASLYKISSNKALFVTSEYFSSTDEYKNEEFESATIDEIKQILSTLKFTN